jgi:EF hand
MQKHVLVLTTFAFFLAGGAITASAQQPGQQQTQQPTGQEDPGMTGPGGIMGRGMMGHGGMMGRGMMGPPVMMRVIFSLMDSDGDGTVSLQEFQAAHERIFKGMDANKDARVTPEEMQAFMQGTGRLRQ